MTSVLSCIIVTFNSADHIQACLNSLAQAHGVTLDITIVDNASTDHTVEAIENWDLRHDFGLRLIRADRNLGFAAGVNLGLRAAMQNTASDRFWILNPDCTAAPETPLALSRVARPFSLLGNRVIYQGADAKIQIDGGQICRWTGKTRNMNIGKQPSRTPLPDPSKLDFISGASMVASRDFLDQAGLMPEQYFLYYEEVDWAQSRGSLPLALCEDAPVFHHAGASIGSPTLDRGPSPLSAYFKHRSRMMFVKAQYPRHWLFAYLYGWAKAAQHALRGQTAPIPAILRGLHGLPAGREINAALGPSSLQAATKVRIRATSSS